MAAGEREWMGGRIPSSNWRPERVRRKRGVKKKARKVGAAPRAMKN